MPSIWVCPPNETLAKVLHWDDAITENSTAAILTNVSTELSPTRVLLKSIDELLKLDADIAQSNNLCDTSVASVDLENAQQRRQVELQNVVAMLSDYTILFDMEELNKSNVLYKLSNLNCNNLVRLFLTCAKRADASGNDSRVVAVRTALDQAFKDQVKDAAPLENLLLHLATESCLLDVEFIKKVRKDFVVSTHPGSLNKDSLLFKEIFDDGHYLKVEYLKKNHVLRDRYLSQMITRPRLIQEDDSPVWPDLVQQCFSLDEDLPLSDKIWQALKKQQKEAQEYSDYFKKITAHFNAILIRLVKAFKKNPEHYRKKLELILKRLSEEAMAQTAWHHNFVTCITEASSEPIDEEAVYHTYSSSLSPRGSVASFDMAPASENICMEVAAKEHVVGIAKSLLYEADIKAKYKYKAFSIFTSKTEKLLRNIETAKPLPIDTIISPQYEQKKPQTLSELKNCIHKISASDTQCVLWQQRSYIASQIFGATLKYLQRRKNTDKFEVMVELIEKFSSGEITGKELIEALNPSQEAYKKLAKKVHDWSFFQPKSWVKPKSARLVSKALKNSELLKIFDASVSGFSM